MVTVTKRQRTRESRRAKRSPGKQARRIPKRFQRQLDAIRKIESGLSSASDSELLQKSELLREEVAQKGYSVRAFNQFTGIVAEAIFRTHGFRLHDVQLGAAAAAAQGNIVEMQTGEGKTVVTGAIAAVKTLSMPSVHVGTTNTYLAARDLEGLVPTFEMLGISCGLLPEETNEVASRRVYRKQVVYGPGYQFGFDYLRDQMHLRENRQSLLGVAVINRIQGKDPYAKLIQGQSHHAALIDEADSVMIDEAMTPMIISLPSDRIEDELPFELARKIILQFEEGDDYKIDLATKMIDVTDQANQKAHEFVAKQKDLRLSRPWRIYVTNAIRAEHVLQREVDYVVVDDEVQIVDQFTGRIMSDRTWQSGLHQAVETKERVPVKPGRESTAQITRQRYLQRYSELAGLTGTAVSVANEFSKIYKCPVVPIPTNVPSKRIVGRTRFFATLQAKLDAITDDVFARLKTGQPILVGTKTIRESHEVRDALTARGIKPTLLNGVQDGEEAEIVAQAGFAGSITIATNMAGRGTDIKLDQRAIESGGLHVIGVSPNASTRIDRQLIGRSARQGKPGSAQFFAAATDSLFVDNASSLEKQIARRAKANGEAGDFSRELLKLQMALELKGFQQRQNMILRDGWMDMVREAIEKD